MHATATLLADACHDWALTDPQLVAETPRAQVYRVQRENGPPAALKLSIPPRSDSETNAAGWLRHFNGEGVVRVFEDAPGRILMEWLDGPDLSVLAFNGRDNEATEIIAHCLSRVLGNSAGYTGKANSLAHYAAALYSYRVEELPADYRAHFSAAQKTARRLFDTSSTESLLHGDLQHFNIARSGRDWLIFDPKSLWGDPHFELANAFCNPFDTERLLSDPDRAIRMAQTFSARLGFDKQRMLDWAFVKMALSLCWEMRRVKEVPDRIRLVAMFAKFASRD